MHWRKSVFALGSIQIAPRDLWLSTILFFGIGDVATTWIALGTAGVVEANPFVVPLVRQYGTLGIVLLKLITLVGGFGVWKLVPSPHCLGVPLGLTAVGVAVTIWNSHLLLLTVVF